MSVFSAKEQKKSVDKAAKIQRETTDKLLAANKPFLDLGEKAVGIITNELNKPLTETESYRFNQAQSNKALDRLLARRGLLDSGAEIRQSLGLEQRLIDNEKERRDNLLRLSLGVGESSQNKNLGFIQNLGLTQSNAALAKGSINSNTIGGLFKLGANAVGAAAGIPPVGSFGSQNSFSGGYSPNFGYFA